MKDKMREPNLDPNSCTDVDFVGFKYLNYVPSENKDEWIKRKMANEVIFNSIIETAEGPYGGLRTKWEWGGGDHNEGVKNQRNYCKIVLERKWDKLFKEEHEKKRHKEIKYKKCLIKLRQKYFSLNSYTHINQNNEFTIRADLQDVIKFVGIKTLIKKDWFSGTRGYDAKNRLIEILYMDKDYFLVKLPQTKNSI